VELDRYLVVWLDYPIQPWSLDQLFGGGQPLPLAAVVGKLGENNPGTVDESTS
jgi:hypothetical protein